MASEGFHYKDRRVEVLHQEADWEALIYRPSLLLNEEMVPAGADRHAVMREAKTLVDQALAP